MRTRTSSISSSSRLSSANHRAVAGRMSSTKMISFPSFPVVAVLCGVLALSDFSVREADAHGRLIEPPSRSSAWRYNFPTAPNYNDHELYCGGFSRQWQKNGGKCGICGDAWDLPQPRPNEAGGRYGQGVIVRKLQKNGPIRIKVELTANHAGFFEFRLCPHNNPKKTASQRCLDKYVLQRMDGDGARYFPTPGRSEVFSMEYQLPKDVVCTQCILQWRYVAGNNWGMCKNGTGMLGCGPQEEFRACADIAILGEGEVTTFEDEDGEQDVHEPPTKDDEDYNEVDSDFNRGEHEAGDEEVFNPAERIAAIVCGFLLTSLVLAAAIGLSYMGKKRIKAFFSRWTPPSVASGLSATSAWFKKRFPFCGGRGGSTKKPPLPTNKNPGATIYGTPSAAINAALERGEKPPMAPMRKHHGGVTNNGMVSATLVAPGLSFNPAAPTGSLKPTAPPIQHPIYQPVARPNEAPPPPPSRPPRQRSPKRQLSSGSTTGSNTADDSRMTPLPTPEDANITVNGVALPD